MKPSTQFGLAVISGLLLVFSFPRFNLAFLAWVALAPLIYAVSREAAEGRLKAVRAFGLGWISGLVFTFLAENWIAHSMTNYGGMLTAVATLAHRGRTMAVATAELFNEGGKRIAIASQSALLLPGRPWSEITTLADRTIPAPA